MAPDKRACDHGTVKSGRGDAPVRAGGGMMRRKSDRRESPYEIERRQGGGCLAQAGMTIVEMAVWLVAMAALALGMLWLLWNCTR